MPVEIMFPYRTLEVDPLLQLTSPTVEGVPRPLLNREGRVALHEQSGPWKTAKVQVRVVVPQEAFDSIGARDPLVVVTVDCSKTNVRAVDTLERGAGNDGHWTGSVTLSRDLLYERAEIYATVAGTVDGHAGRWLGRSSTWQVDMQPPRAVDVSQGEIPSRWRDFTETEPGDNPIDPTYHGEISYADLDAPDGPVIYLNDSIKGLRRLLEERTGRTRVERAIRETTLDAIAQPAIVAMANAALADAAPADDSDEIDFPLEDWKRGVLESLLPLMYPDREIDSALETAVTSMTGDGAADVQTRIQAAAGRHVKSTNHSLGVLRALESLDEEMT